MKSLLIDVLNEEVKVVEVENGLEDYYKYLNCDCIDIASRKIGRKYYDIVVDDEGLLKSEPKISAINDLGGVMLVGNLMVLNSKDGELTTLTNDDIKYIKKRIVKLGTRKHPTPYPMLKVEY